MKKLIAIIVILAVCFVILQIVLTKIQHDLSQSLPYPTTSPEPTREKQKDVRNIQESISLFVPDWTLSTEPIEENTYDSFIYFGVSPSEKGLTVNDEEKQKIDSFLAVTPDKQKLLAIRMTNTEQNLALLKTKQWKQTLITESISLAKEKGFSGIVLDLEISAVPFDSLTTQVTSFVSDFSQASKKENLSFSITMYGDAFYRSRPFVIKDLAPFVDQILLMAYDFHKARGTTPGPNFPLFGKKEYGYDMQTMIRDFSAVVPKEKLVVVFGFFGYDWMTNTKGIAISQGKARTNHALHQQFVPTCQYENCTITRDPLSQEVKIQYGDDEGKQHIFWSEDETSIEKKKTFLKQEGITHFSYWAYSYF